MILPGMILARAIVSAPGGGPPAPALFDTGVEVVRVVRVFTGADGESHFQDTTLRGGSHPFFKTGKMVEQTVLGPSAKVSLISGPGDQVLPMHATPPVMLLELVGSSVVTVASGEERQVTPGTLVIFDDANSKSGHGGRTGPGGYVALSLAPPETMGPGAAAHAP